MVAQPLEPIHQPSSLCCLPQKNSKKFFSNNRKETHFGSQSRHISRYNLSFNNSRMIGIYGISLKCYTMPKENGLKLTS
jgi:hypothetical protein